MGIAEIVDVQISIQDKAVTRAGFGVGLILGDSAGITPDRVREYASLEEVSADFGSSDPEYVAASAYFAQELKPEKVKIGRIDVGDADIAASLDAVQAEDDDWYCLLTTGADDTTVSGAAAWIQSQKKIYIANTASSDAKDGTEPNIAKTLQDADYDRTALLWSANAATEYPAAAWAGGILPQDPGSVTWAFKSLSGVTVDDLTSTEKSTLQGYNANTYTSVGGVSIVQNGTMASGRFIDVRRGVDWLKARIEENVYSRIVNLPKIPYTNAGVGVIVGEINAVLSEGVRKEVLKADPAPTVEAPEVSEVSANDRALRLLPDVKFFAELAGAIHKIQIRGTVSV